MTYSVFNAFTCCWSSLLNIHVLQKVQSERKWHFHSCSQKHPSDVLEFRPPDLQKHQAAAPGPVTQNKMIVTVWFP